MKINEVEARAGITKKNIRFYEEQGLLSPRRNAENGYREYGEEEVEILRRIRILRKLGVPIEEIRQMLRGTHTLGDGMRRHLITLEREQRNLTQSIALCQELQFVEAPVMSLDADALQARMEELEQGGTVFKDNLKKDVRTQLTMPILVTILMTALMTGLSGLVIWAYLTEPNDAPPFGFILGFIILFLGIAVGTVIALFQRIQEIQKGEMDDAKSY